MNGISHTIKRAIAGVVLAAAGAAFVASSALASGGNSPPISYAGATTARSDGYAAVLERHFRHEDSFHTKTVNTPSQCPCNSGLPGAAGTTGAVVASSGTAPSSQCPCNAGLVGGPRVSTPIRARRAFNWSAAGIGGGVGLALIALAVGIFAARAGDDPLKKRRRLARRLERAAVPEHAVVCRGPRYIVRPDVTLACAPSLRAIAAALRDEALVVGSGQLDALLRFVSHGDSPFFGDDPTAALRQAVRLQHAVVGTEKAALDHDTTAAAA